jgi:hypothetical protein
MSSRTKKYLAIAFVVAALVIAGVVIFLRLIQAEAVKLEEQAAVLNENNAKEATYTNLKRLTTETEEVRGELSSAFFKNEGETIVFLGQIEEQARLYGLALKTESLDKVEDKEKKEEYIKISFAFDGQKQRVLNFAKLLENIPYHSRLENLSIKNLAGSNWQGKATVIISINSL